MRKLLLVEDDTDTSSLLKYVLEDENFEVQVAPSVDEARTAFASGGADMIIIDRGLPDGDGLDLCREIRGQPQGMSLPVMFLTAHKTPEDIKSGMAAGADDYLAKPFSFVEFISRIETLWQRQAGV